MLKPGNNDSETGRGVMVARNLRILKLREHHININLLMLYTHDRFLIYN